MDNQDLNRCPPIQLMEEIIEYVKTIHRPVGKIGIIGFFDGATLAYLTASRLQPDFAVAYFGGDITSYLTEGKNIKCPMIIHEFEPKKTATGIGNNKLEAALIGKENISIYNYIRKQNIDQSNPNSLLSSETLNKAHERTLKLLENLNFGGK